MEEEDLNDNIILDSGSSIDIFINPKLVKDINRINQVLHLSTDVGYRINQMQEMVSDYGKFWYDDNYTVNILLLKNLVKKYRVTYDSHQYYAFGVNTNI